MKNGDEQPSAGADVDLTPKEVQPMRSYPSESTNEKQHWGVATKDGSPLEPDSVHLLQACAQGVESAWNAFFERYYDFVAHIARRTFRALGPDYTHQDAEDVCADVFLDLIENDFASVQAFGAPGRLNAWLWTIARRRAMRFARESQQRSALSLQSPAADGKSETPLSNILPAGNGDPHRLAVRAEYDRIVDQAAAALPVRLGSVLHLHYFDGLKCREIAERLSLPLGTVVWRLSEARSRLRDTLSDHLDMNDH